MKKLIPFLLIILASSCSTATPTTSKAAAVPDNPPSAAELENAAFTAMDTAIPLPEEELPGIEVVPISKMAPKIPWLETDNQAIPSTTFIGVNYQTPPFDNPMVRKAFSQAIDRQRVAAGSVTRGDAASVPATTFIPPLMLGRDLYGTVGLNFDGAAAKQALVDAGFTDPSQLPEIEIVFYEGSTELVTAYLEMWKTSLGVDVIPVPVKSGEELYAYIDNQKPGLFILGMWIADYNDPNNFTKDTFLNPATHYPSLAGTKFENLANSAEVGVNDPAARQKLYIEIEKILCEDEVYVIPVTHTLAKR